MVILHTYKQFIFEKFQILNSINDFHARIGNDPLPYINKYTEELEFAVKTIKYSPFRFPDFPPPIKKCTFSHGTFQSAILYSVYPQNHNQEISKVKKIYLGKIFLTNSKKYNDYCLAHLPKTEF